MEAHKNSLAIVLVFLLELISSCKQDQIKTIAASPQPSILHIVESADSFPQPDKFDFGRKASRKEIVRWDIDVNPDGKGLPSGKGLATSGKLIFDSKCVACHGIGGVGGANGSLVTSKEPSDKRKEKTIGNYWPYATTIFDYIRRAMPFNAPGSLTDEEVYHLTAYLLHANDITNEKTIIDSKSLPKIIMPAHEKFVPDDRVGGNEIK